MIFIWGLRGIFATAFGDSRTSEWNRIVHGFNALREDPHPKADS
jgi:hypothetical protein